MGEVFNTLSVMTKGDRIAKRDHILHFYMLVFQRSVFLKCYVQSKSNAGVL